MLFIRKICMNTSNRLLQLMVAFFSIKDPISFTSYYMKIHLERAAGDDVFTQFNCISNCVHMRAEVQGVGETSLMPADFLL